MISLFEYGVTKYFASFKCNQSVAADCLDLKHVTCLQSRPVEQQDVILENVAIFKNLQTFTDFVYVYCPVLYFLLVRILWPWLFNWILQVCNPCKDHIYSDHVKFWQLQNVILYKDIFLLSFQFVNNRFFPHWPGIQVPCVLSFCSEI